MRIIAGQRRGHTIEGPAARETRPTSDFVRETIFNILGGRVEGAWAVDLFAGTGALGLEALSRGARRAIFVEIHRENVAVIRRNLATLRYEDRGVALLADVYRWARRFDLGGEGVAVVFVDPPYREYENHPDRVTRMLADLTGRLPVGSTLVVEASQRTDEMILPEADAWDRRRYGSTTIALRTIGAVDGDDEPEPDGPV